MNDKKKSLTDFPQAMPGSVAEIPSPEVAAVVSATEATGTFAAMPPSQYAADEMSQLLGLHKQPSPEIGDGSVNGLITKARKRDPNP